MQMTGYITRETEAAVAFHATRDAVKPLWLPRKKISSLVEIDALSVQIGQYRATPVSVDVDEAFLQRIVG